MGDEYTAEEYAAAAAARDADPLPQYMVEGTPLGHCRACEARFEYRGNTDIGNLDPCPACGSLDWRKWGYRIAGDDKPLEVLQR